MAFDAKQRQARQRASIRRTVCWLVAVAVAFYAGFIWLAGRP